MRTDLLRPLAVGGAVFCSAVLQPATPFRAGIDLVRVYATVMDKQRRLISDLSKDDFQLFDNGIPQSIALFSNDVQPISIVVMLDRSGGNHASVIAASADHDYIPVDYSRW